MLVVRRVGEQGHRYYLAQIGPPGLGERPGAWLGVGAEALGLAGMVGATELSNLLHGYRPDGEPLVLRRAGRVAGLDLMFAAPKSVSIAHALADADVSSELRLAHDRAVRATLGYLEREACVVRQGPDRRAQGDGLVGAAFRHRVSRADDPHLHTHVLVANAAMGPTGRWSALHTPLVFAEVRTAGSLYRAALRHEVSIRLDWGWANDGLERGELLGVPRSIVVEFSRRHAQVEEEMKARHCSSAVAADVTRQRRHHLIDHDQLVHEWHRRAEALGFAPPSPVRHRPPARATSTPLPDRDVFIRADMVRAWSDRLVDGADISTVEHLAEASLTSAAVRPLSVARTAGPARLDGAGGSRERFTSEEVLRQRRLLLGAPRVAVVLHAGGIDRELLAAASSTGRPVVAAAASPARAARLAATAGAIAAPWPAVARELRWWSAGRAPAVVVDRADRTPTAALAELARRAARVDGRIILVGEPDGRRWSDTFARLAELRTVELPPRRRGVTAQLTQDVAPPWLTAVVGREPTGLQARCHWREAATALLEHGEHWQCVDTPERRRLERLVSRVAIHREGPVLGLR